MLNRKELFHRDLSDEALPNPQQNTNSADNPDTGNENSSRFGNSNNSQPVTTDASIILN